MRIAVASALPLPLPLLLVMVLLVLLLLVMVLLVMVLLPLLVPPRMRNQHWLFYGFIFLRGLLLTSPQHIRAV